MAEKIYENSKQVSTNIIANNVKTLNDVIWKEIATTSGRGSVSIFSSNKADYLQKRQAEITKGYLTKEEYSWFVDKYFKQLPNWHSLYLMQGAKYDITTYSAYSNYLASYKAIQGLYSILKTIKPSEDGTYSISDLSDIWLEVWRDYYEKCDGLDSVIIAKIKETSIQKAITEYSVNQLNDVPPNWKTEEYDSNWSTTKPQKLETYQALWARTKYYYLDKSITRNRPYLVSKATTKKEESEEEKTSTAMSLYLSRDTARWSARGLKVEKEIIMTCIYEDILKVTYELSYGSGVSFADTEADNEKRIITPTLASEMSDQIVIRAFVVDSQNNTIAEATTTLKKEIIGTTDPTYIGCLESVPSGYTHDGIVDNLIKGDYFLCKGKSGTDPDSDFMFGIVYELVDPNSFTSRAAWQVCTDTEKIAKTISDSIAIGAYSQETGTFNNLIVNKSSTLNGDNIINDSLTVNASESKFKHILPLENETYNIGSNDLKWLYAYIKNLSVSGNVLTDLIPNATNSRNLGNSSYYWNYIYGNNIYGNLYNKNGNSPVYQYQADYGTTMALQNNGSVYSGSGNTTTIYWSVVYFTDNNSNRYALCCGNGLRGSMNICDCSARVYLPISYSQVSENYGYGYNIRASVGLNTQSTGSGINRTGNFAVMRGSSTWRSNNYFCVNGDALPNNSEIYSFHFLVWGRV